MDIVPNLDEASRPLADAWQQTLQATRPEAAALLADLAAHSPPDLAHHFYDVLLEDPRASRFLSHDQVRLRLKPAMQRWLTQLLTATPASVAALVAAQRVIGDVHARVGIPVDLVTRGTRVLKQRLFERIVAKDLQLRPGLPSGVAAHARLANINHGRLVYLVDAPVWHAKLRLAEAQLLDAARSIGLKVTKVTVKTAAAPPPRSPAIDNRNGPHAVSAATHKGLRDALACLQDVPSKPKKQS